ncbi:MAG: hypothetical protein FWE62_03375 [Firmicutes bacterium]|nr:hypothetical protein [Bacillota bacterium]
MKNKDETPPDEIGTLSTDGRTSVKSDVHESKEKPKDRKKRNIWFVKAFILTLFLAAAFSFFSEFTISGAPLVVAICVLVFLIAVSIVFDVVAMAFAVCDPAPFHAMASRKIRGARASLRLLKNATAVTIVCSDVIGDVIGVVSGASGATIAVSVIRNAEGLTQKLVAIAVSSLIAAITVGSKAFFKDFAFKRNQKIVLVVGKVLSIFIK